MSHPTADITTSDRPAASRSPRRRRPAAVLAEIALTLGSLLGVVVMGVTVMAARSGYQPLVVKSGSMEPTIATGSMVLVKRIPATAIEVGDIVAVQRPDRTRVTHRVMAVELRDGTAELTLKGDANEDPDPLPVTARHADRLAWQVPALGRSVAWLATAQGGFVMGCLFAAVVLRVLGRRPAGGLWQPSGRHFRPRGGAAVGAH